MIRCGKVEMFQVFIRAVSIITKQIKSRLPLPSKTKGIHKVIPDHVNPHKRRYKLGGSGRLKVWLSLTLMLAMSWPSTTSAFIR